MKYICIISIAVISCLSAAFSVEVKVTPLLLNFYKIENNGGALAALADHGCARVSFDGGASWKASRPFVRGVVVKMDFLKDSVIALNSLGDVSISFDKGKSWQARSLVQDTILDAISSPGGYYLRSGKALYRFSNSFDLTAQISLNSDYVLTNKTAFGGFYQKSMALFKGDLIVSIDSGAYARLTPDLNPKDTFSLSNLGVYNDSTKFFNNAGVVCDTSKIYFLVDLNMNRVHYAWTNTAIITTEDFKSIKEYTELKYQQSIYSDKNGMHLFDVNNALFYYKDDGNKYTDNLNFANFYKDFTVRDDRIFIVGSKNLIRSISLKDSSFTEISDATYANPIVEPTVINDSAFFLHKYSTAKDCYTLGLMKTQNDGLTFEPTIVRDEINQGYVYINDIYFKYHDSEKKQLHFICPAMTEFSYDIVADYEGKRFTFNQLNDLKLFNNFFPPYYANAFLPPELKKLGDNFVISLGVDKTKKKYTKLALLDSSFNKIRDIVALDAAVDYYYAVDTLTYFVHCANMKDSTSEVRYTTDAGDSWTTIAKYDPYYEEIFVKDVTSKGKTYIMLAHRNIIDNKEEIDIIDVDARYKLKFEEWSKADDPTYKPSEIRFLSDENFVYVTRGDKLYAYPDLLNKSGMRFRTFPNGGRVVGPITQYGKRFIATYEDDYNAPNLCILEPIVPLSASDEAQVERANYLYCFPAFPNPAKDEVRSLIYWDTSLDIEKDDISVYSIYGKVAGREDITIEKTAPYSGYLVWNCSRYEPGAYFIVIKHGDAQWAIKIMIND
ncbi:MAG: hypothetical protein ACM3U1_12290 [Chloroflexota bacterium]